MQHNARVLSLSADSDIRDELRRVGAEDAGIRHMSPKSRHYLVKIDDVRRPLAHILKETFLSNGGDAAVHTGIITAAVDYSDVIIMGTRKQYDRSLVSLKEQPFGGDKLAAEIEAAIRNSDSPPSVPDEGSERLRRMFAAIGTRTLIMGILNVTPDSFADGGRYLDPAAAAARAREMAEFGTDIIDIGGESTRPGSNPVSPGEEIERVIPVIRELAGSIDVPISIDTCKAEVASAALDAGAHIINDISAATFDPDMPALISERRCPAILMHIKGAPKTMQSETHYDDLLGEVFAFLKSRVQALVEAGADELSLMVDPGIGFAKTVEQNLELMRRLREFKSIGRPIVIGTSRKSTIGKVLGDLPIEERLEGTAATVAISIANGADIVRVHDVKEMARVAKMADAITR